MKNTKKMVTAALLAAFTCIATMIIKIPTPTFGYIHLGDGLVLLCGIILGPGIGALAAGIGSMFADIFSGYMTWAPATLIIKALTACIAGLLFHKLRLNISSKANRSVRVVIGGIIGEALMVLGYFLRCSCYRNCFFCCRYSIQYRPGCCRHYSLPDSAPGFK